MQVSFHWVRVQTFCYATEDRELLEETMCNLVDPETMSEDISEGEHGNQTVIIESRITKQREFNALFSKLPQHIRDYIVEDIDNRVDEDCILYLRLDKQKAVQGIYEVAHHGDVIAITAKIQAHPAKPEVARKVLLDFLAQLPPAEAPSSRTGPP